MELCGETEGDRRPRPSLRVQTKEFLKDRKSKPLTKMGRKAGKYLISDNRNRTKRGHRIRKRIETLMEDYKLLTGQPIMYMAMCPSGSLRTYSADRPVSSFIEKYFLPRLGQSSIDEKKFLISNSDDECGGGDESENSDDSNNNNDACEDLPVETESGIGYAIEKFIKVETNEAEESSDT